jgi:hypothetical protein
VIAHADGINIGPAVKLTIDKISERIKLLDDAAQAVDAWCRGTGASPDERFAIHAWTRGLRDFQNHADWYVHHARYALSAENEEIKGKTHEIQRFSRSPQIHRRYLPRGV